MGSRKIFYPWLGSIVLVALLLAACSASETVLRARILSSDLSVGTNRLVFIVVDENAERVQVPEAQISAFYIGNGSDSTGEPAHTAPALFRRWPLSNTGVYTARVTLDTAGQWRAEVKLTSKDGSLLRAEGFFNVAPVGFTPAIGALAPRSLNKTVRDVNALEELTTSPEPDPDLYQLTIAEAVDSGKPLVLVFATPAFCTSLTCGPQVDEIQKLKNGYQGRVNFIHVEVYDNPHLIQGDLASAELAPAVTEWRLQNEPWTFVVDAQGQVADKFEGFATIEELESSLLRVLQ